MFHENNRFYSANIGCNGDGFYMENTGAHESRAMYSVWRTRAVDTASMWPTSGACETIRETPDPEDIAGLVSLYAGSSSPAPTTPPVRPRPASVSAGSPTSSLVLAWVDTATDDTGYRVERSPNGSNFSQVAQLASNVTSTWILACVRHDLLLPRVRVQRRRHIGLLERRLRSDAGRAARCAKRSPERAQQPQPGKRRDQREYECHAQLDRKYSDPIRCVFQGCFGRVKSHDDIVQNGGTLLDGTPYSWSVVVKNASGSTSGPAWSFTTKAAPGKGKK